MDDFLRYFEDTRFINWVFIPNDELNHYWEQYIRNHPEEKKQIEFSILLLQSLKSKKEENISCDAAELFANLIIDMPPKEKVTIKGNRHIFGYFLRYAAIAIIFFVLGILVVRQYEENKFAAFNQSNESIHNDNDARLILSSGKKITLPEVESSIVYEKNGKIIINHRDTIDDQKQTAGAEMNQLIIPYGKNSSITLPDGTLAYLNAGSRLMYPTAFRGKTREVFLLGEGYFEVAKNPKKPFVVNTNDLSILATGTIFNVSAYPAEKIIETVLVEGKVVIRVNSFKILTKEFELKPNDLASFSRETFETKTKQVEITNYVDWHNGYLNFQSTDLNRIVVKLERYYNIKIFLDDPMLGMRRISGKLALREDMKKVLEVLASTSQTEIVEINEKTFGLK
ncbi:MAG: FecR domain-containing protein [Bacteroidota bacterium]|nr:hypothetical protein [Odoribacter sp.]MDP3642341.1 FecR domain-containing protein [Bacteroidota bacterium]